MIRKLRNLPHQRHCAKRREDETATLLWTALKRFNASGYHFRKRSPFAGFMLDFVDHDIRLVVEIAPLASTPSPDIARHHVLVRAGYTVLKFRRDDVVRDFSGVVETLNRVLDDRPPSTD